MFACSGPGAGQAITESIRTSEIHAGVLALLLLGSIAIAYWAGKRSAAFILLALLAIHPLWTISAQSGDCGSFKVWTSWLCTGIACVAFLWQTVVALEAKRAPRPPSAPTSN
jgi:hypothetical protein